MPEFEKIVVDIPNKQSHSYDIILGRNVIEDAGEYIKDTFPLLKSLKTIIITDQNIAKHHLKSLTSSLDISNISHNEIILESGEFNKSFKTLEPLLEDIFKYNPDRNVVLIAFGGGVVGDLVGFAASILLRGVKFVQIPTTMLSQVDSSVGGKTGINNKFGKNLIGSFWQPSLVISDIKLLETLPKRDYLSGYAEVLKYSLINDKKFFNYLISNEEGIIGRDNDILKYIVSKACAIKSEIVMLDEKEAGARALLNLGHTFGHAFEAETEYNSSELLHGEAVAIGIVLAFVLSAKLDLGCSTHVEKIKKHLKKVGLPCSAFEFRENWNIQALLSHMRKDKKAYDNKLTFILARDIGKAFISREVLEKDLLDVLHAELK